MLDIKKKLERKKGLMSKYIGDRQYYKTLLVIAIPLALTNLLQSCMSIVDTIMVSGIGMLTSVGNAGNIIQLTDGITWGIVSGIAVYAAQFYGANQKDNLARIFGLCLILLLANCLFWILMVYLFGEELLGFYLKDGEIIKYSLEYLRIDILSLIPAYIAYACSTMYRSMHNTRLPFIISIIASLTNVIANYYCLYIIKIGVKGAAIGTLFSQIVACVIYIIFILKDKPIFFVVDKIFDLHLGFIKPVLDTTWPIILNESLFGFGMSLFNKAYGILGTKAMDAIYVANQVFNMFTFIIWGYGSAVSIMIGTKLGEAKIDEAIKESKWHLGFSFLLGIFMSLLMITFAGFYLKFFNINDIATYNNARNILYVFALKLFIRMFTYMIFSTLKAGGDSKILNLYDSGFMYMIGLPLAFLGAYFGIKNIALLVLLVQIEQVVRLIFSLRRFNLHIWAKDLTKLVIN